MIKNNRIQRLTALIISLVMVLSLGFFVPTAAEENDVQTDSAEIALLQAVGIISDNGISTTMMSRADFVVYAARIIGMNDLQQSTARYFYDVPMEHYAVGAINKFVELNIISVDDKKEFRPDETVTYSEAAKILVSALGYEELANVYGGYPAGYTMMARRIGLADGVPDGELSADSAVRMLYNALKADVEDIIAIKNDGIVKKADGETVLSVYHNIAFAEGSVTATDGMSMYSDIEAEKGETYIDDVKFYADCDMTGVFGSYVEYYYKKDNSDRVKTIVFANELSEDSVVISTKDFESYNDDKITYFKGDKDTTVSVASNKVVVYNGRPYDSDPKALLDSLNYGYITVKSSDNKTDNLIIIDDYKDMLVSGISKQKETISDSNLSGMTIDIGKADYVVIKNAEGTDMEYTSLTTDTLLVVKASKDRKYIYAEVSEGVTSGKVKSVFVQDGFKHIVVDDVEYTLTKVCADKFNVTAGISYRFYLNKENDIAYVDLSGATNMEPGYITNAIVNNEGFSDTVKLRILDSSGKRVAYETADRVKIDGVTYNEAKKILAAFPSDSDVKDKVEPQLIMFNEVDGKITEIDTYGGDPEKEDKKTTLDRKVVDKTAISLGETNFSSNRFGHNTMVRTGGKLFTVPESDEINTATDRKFNCQTTTSTIFSSFSSGGANLTFYRLGTDVKFWDYIVNIGDAASSIGNGNMAVITDIYEMVNADEEVVNAVSVYEALEKGASPAEYEISENVKVTKVTGPDTVEGTDKKVSVEIPFSDLEKGDTIRYAYSGDIISEIELLYDLSNGGQPTWAGVDAEKSRYQNVKWYSENFQLSFGYVHSTKQDVLSWGYKSGADEDESWNLFVSANTYGSRMVIWDTEKEEAYVGNMTDLIDYETYGADADISRIIFRTNLRTFRGIIAYL